MELFVIILSALLLSGYCRGGPAALTPESGTCWVMGNLHNTFDQSSYTYVGNCTYIMAKNCHVDATLPAFEVDTKNVNEGNTGLPSVGTITVSVYGFNIEIVRSQVGFVRVNYQQWNLPINLNNSQLKLYQKGLFVVVEADFGLTVQYDWNQYLAISLPGSFAGSVCGLCGNFNNKKEDDLMTPSGSVTSSVAALGASWKVPGTAGDAYCQDECGSRCDTCPLSQVQKLEQEIFCRALIQNYAELLGCQLNIDSSMFQNNCMLNLCRGEAVTTYLCNSLQGYADICQTSGARSIDWRASAQCPTPNCPDNSHYEFCGSACPATCANTNTTCNSSCVEACVCNNGFILSGSQCVPKDQCGCTYKGRYVEAKTSFWGDKSCTELYTCSAGGSLSVSQTGCPSGQQCQVMGGLRGCYPLSYATCMVSGDPHFVTFDGKRYNFQGTCTYEMAGVSSNQTSLEKFSVVLQNSSKDKRIGSIVQVVEVMVYGYNVTISKKYSGAIVVNGELSNLPMTLDSNKIHVYTSGWFAVIETDFGVKVYYDWNSVAFVIVPSTYMGAMQGLCGNYNLNPKDDMQMRDGSQASATEELGQSWKLASVPGCVDGCSSPCPGCNSTQRALYNTSSYCGLISDPAGPFRDCHSTVDPTGFLNDCLYDACLYQGSSRVQCKTLTAYTAACQLKGATVYPWRSAQFCDAQCPSNSHYELCTSGCLGLCEKNSTISNCGAQCMEGCACNEGYLLSGNECVPANQCGCMYEGKYYQQGQVFYPDALCQMECTCNGAVQCEQFSCGPYETCGSNNSVRSCQPLGKGVCSISGDPHYNTFDNSTYNFQGTCTYVAAEGCNLNGTRLTGFSVVVENEKWFRMSDDPQVSVAKLVAVEVYGLVLILRRNDVNMVWVNGVLHQVPLILLNGAVKVYQGGKNDVILTDFGLKVTYDLVYHITITVPENYRGKTCGMCGNFNNNKADEFQLPDGSVTKDFQAFGAAWKVPVPGVVCDDGCSGDLCPTCDDSEKAAIEAECAIITNPTGPFAACHDVISPLSYYNDCVYDVCISKYEQNMLCKSIAAYMLDCQDFGVQAQKWRSPSFCPFPCGHNSHYETCMMPCASPCPGLLDTLTCTATCVEGCACDNNYYYNGTGCVPFDQCSCYYNGRTYKVGEPVITDDCQKIVTCQASGVVVSTNMTCDPNEICQVRNGVMGCHLQQCSLTTNGTLTTFNGEYGTITAPGAYEMIQNCNQSDTSDWFRVVASLQPCTPGFNTLLAFYVFFNDMIIAVSYKHDIWIDGREMTETTFSQNNVIIEVSDDTVRINSSSTIQLSFSSANELIITVSDDIVDTVCGACGKLVPVATGELRQKLLVSLHKIPFSLASLDIGQWTSPDFPQCE